MTEGETSRLIAWAAELRHVHARLRAALDLTRHELDSGGDVLAADLLLLCHGFCAALDGHHRAEDRTLFPAIRAAHPDLAPVLASLERDHAMLAHLLGGLQTAVTRGASRPDVDAHLEGVAALTENHFRYEERALLTVLEALSLEAGTAHPLGPL